jgi:hypothetical protein
MSRLVDSKEAIIRDHRVHLRRCYRCMTEQLLNCSDIGAMVEHVCCATMAKHMRRESAPQSGGITVFANNRPGSLPTESSAAHVQEDRVSIAATRKLLGSEGTSAVFVEPLGKCNACEPPDRHDTLFRPFSEKTK